jgi:phenylacetate-CoA ligase
MAILNPQQVAKDVKDLLDFFEVSQWKFIPDVKSVLKHKIIDREGLRRLKMVKGLFTTKTSGSTGVPLQVEKYYLDYIWYIATNIREFRWRNWDVKKNIAIIKPRHEKVDTLGWGIPVEIEPIQGMKYSIGYEPISEIQKWLELKNPHYIQVAPSIAKQLDFTKLSNYIDHKGTGEVGGSMYSSEECGTIAIQCPDNPDSMHVMENIIIETDKDNHMIVTCIHNPYIKRYKHGDVIEMGECDCGRTLQTIKKVHGRVRNMFVLPNGDKKWPLIGSKEYYEKFGIKRFKAIQTDINTLELQIISDNLGNKENELISFVKEELGSPIDIVIKYVDDFPNYKFEEFVSLIK